MMNLVSVNSHALKSLESRLSQETREHGSHTTTGENHNDCHGLRAASQFEDVWTCEGQAATLPGPQRAKFDWQGHRSGKSASNIVLKKKIMKNRSAKHERENWERYEKEKPNRKRRQYAHGHTTQTFFLMPPQAWQPRKFERYQNETLMWYEEN